MAGVDAEGLRSGPGEERAFRRGGWVPMDVRGRTWARDLKPMVDGSRMESEPAVASATSPHDDSTETYCVRARGGRTDSRKSISEEVVK